MACYPITPNNVITSLLNLGRPDNKYQIANTEIQSGTKLNFITLCYDTQHCNLQGHSSLTPICLYSKSMNFDELYIKNSSLRFDSSCSTKHSSLNFVLWYDALVANSASIIQ